MNCVFGVFFLFVVFLLTVICNGEFLYVLEECDPVKKRNSCCSERNKNRILEQYGETSDPLSLSHVLCPAFSTSFSIVCLASCQTSDDVKVTALQAKSLNYIF